MNDAVLIRGIRAHGRHGVLEWERHKTQPFEVDLDIEVDLAGAGASDRLEDTVDYADVIEHVGRIVTGESFSLLERLGEAIAGAVLEHPRAMGVTVVVRKMEPPVEYPVGSVGVQLTRRPAAPSAT